MVASICELITTCFHFLVGAGTVLEGLLALFDVLLTVSDFFQLIVRIAGSEKGNKKPRGTNQNAPEIRPEIPTSGLRPSGRLLAFDVP